MANINAISTTFGTTGAKFGSGFMSGGYGTLPTSVLTLPCTVDQWVKPSSTGFGVVLGSLTGSSFYLTTVGNNVEFHYNPADNKLASTTAPLADGAWHHVRVVMTASSVSLSIDGAPVASAAAGPVLPTSATIGIGAINDGSYGYSGAIDELAIFSVALPTAYTVPTAAYPNTQAGLVGLYHMDGNGTNAVVAPAVSLVVSPGSATVNAGSSSVSITPTLTGSAAALTAAVAGGGTISTATPASGATFAYTSPAGGSGTATITVSDVTDGLTATTTIGYSAPAVSMTLAPSVLVGGSANQVVTVTASGASLVGTTFALAGGLGAYLVNQVVNSGTAATLTINPGLAGNGSITVTNSGGTTANVAVSTPPLGTLKIGFIGDSITAGTGGDPVGAANAFLAGLGYTVTTVNRGIGGTSTQDWAAGTATLNNAIAAFQAAGVTIVQVALGTNDARTPNAFTPAQHTANLRGIVQALRAAGMQVVLNKPIWTRPNAGSPGQLWPNDPAGVYLGYWTRDLGLVDGINVFAGDSGGFAWAQLSPGTAINNDGIHPRDGTANTTLGQYWAVAILHRAGPLRASWSYS